MKTWMPTILVFLVGFLLAYYVPSVGDMTVGKLYAK